MSAWDKNGVPCGLEKEDVKTYLVQGRWGTEKKIIKTHRCTIEFCPYKSRICKAKIEHNVE